MANDTADLLDAVRLLEDRQVAIYRHAFARWRDQLASRGRHRGAAMFSALAILLDDEQHRRRATLTELDPDRHAGDAEWTSAEGSL